MSAKPKPSQNFLKVLQDRAQKNGKSMKVSRKLTKKVPPKQIEGQGRIGFSEGKFLIQPNINNVIKPSSAKDMTTGVKCESITAQNI